jgi:hypothetical protein
MMVTLAESKRAQRDVVKQDRHGEKTYTSHPLFDLRTTKGILAAYWLKVKGSSKKNSKPVKTPLLIVLRLTCKLICFH